MNPLFENAIDSLQTGMQFFHDKRPKYAILLVFHSVELLLKELLSRHHQVLIYRNIDKTITDDSQTVGLNETLARFENVGVTLTEAEKTTLKTLQRRRNRIEHHRYDHDDDDQDTLGEALKFIMSFVVLHLDDDLDNHIDKDLLGEIEKIVLSYDDRRADANHRFEAWAERTYEGGFESDDFRGTVDCPVCSQEYLVLGEPRIGNYCFFCQAQVNAVECEHCGRTFLPDDRGGKLCDFCSAYDTDA